MDINFENISYLKYGTHRQRKAYQALTKHKILLKLECFQPILVGTIPINIDIESSDLDIICYFTDRQEFQNVIMTHFSGERNFTITEHRNPTSLMTIANFFVDDFEIEIFGQNTPTKQQFAYRHLIIEHKLLNKHGEVFRQQIIELKQQGHKTEPAFAIALNLTGDPYMELLKFETNE